MEPAASGVLDVSIVIPHYAGPQILECLSALECSGDRPNEIIVVDDASVDGSIDEAKSGFPAVRIVRNERNLGFVGACNRGIEGARSAYIALLNDDAFVEAGWLAPLVAALDTELSLAAVQPKILQANDHSRFDYAGAAGGLIDRYGYPFALGRWFERCEIDTGQYDRPRDIFWASGAAMLLRASVCREIGYLEPAFRMHMEEIDWCWRARVAGYRIANVPNSRVFHVGAATLRHESLRKAYLNHRNSFLMLLKNYEAWTLLRVLPFRIALEAATALGALVTGNFRRALAAVAGPIGAVWRFRLVAGRRRAIQRARRRSDREVAISMYGGSIAVRYLFGRSAPDPEEMP